MAGELEDGSPLGMVAQAVRHEVWVLRPLADLLAAIPGLSDEVFSVGYPAWRVLDRLDDYYQIEDGWCAVPTVQAARDETRTYLDDLADDFGLVELASFDVVVPEGEPRPGWLADWLVHCGYELQDGHVLTRTGSVQDYAASVLAVVGQPLRSEQILARFRVARSVGALKNALSIDERFVKTDRNVWALTSRFSVSAKSVVVYTTGAPFKVMNGMVDLAGRPSVPQRGPEKTRRYFRRGDSWVHRRWSAGLPKPRSAPSHRDRDVATSRNRADGLGNSPHGGGFDGRDRKGGSLSWRGHAAAATARSSASRPRNSR
jgi:hypothetical protein